MGATMGVRCQLPTAMLLWVLAIQQHRALAAQAQPSLVSQNGHLLLVAGEGRNISLVTSGAGCVNVNGENLVLVAKMARNASQTVTRLRSVQWPALEASVQSLLAAVDGPQGLKRRVAGIEEGVANGTMTAQTGAGSSTRVIALTRRVFTLERQVRELRALLTSNECASNPCRNGGECRDKYNGFECRCPGNWKGVLCDTDVNECANFAGTDLGCQNGATCLNKPGTYECACPPGWFGVHCTRRSGDCSQASNQDLCGHGVCVTQHPNGFTCICEQGWTTNGVTKTCMTDVDECAAAQPPCSRSPTVACVNLPGSFRCAACPPGFEGDGFYCADVDECARANGDCSPLVACVNTHGSRVCTPCPPGYQGDGTRCVFRGGPCATNNGGCHPDARCADNSAISASYVSCTCAHGFTGNGVGPLGCRPDADADPCATAQCGQGRCERTDASTHRCVCPAGFTGSRCELLLDACASSPCLNGGSCNRTTSGFRCYCPSGYSGDTCADQRQACGGRIRQQSGSVKYPESPSGAPYTARVSCAWVLQVNDTQVVNVTFSSFHLEESPDCNFDWLQVHDGDSTAEQSLGKFCGRRTPFSLVSTTNKIYLWFRSDHTVAGDGFELSWNATAAQCGGAVVASSHGTLSSPGAPGKYPPSRDCYWQLVAPITKRLQFHFFSLVLQASRDDCSQDYLAIHNGATPNGPLLAKFCNTSRPTPLMSSGSVATVHFHSDATGSAPGFQMSYTVVEGFPGCGGMLTAPLGDIVSPRDPGASTYKSAVDCEWRIQLAVDERIQLTFVTFKLEESRSCSFDFVEIREGEDASAPLVARFCGSVVPRPYTSTGNVLRLRFRSDFSNAREGFHVKYQAVCGGEFGAPTGVLTSPDYPRPYPDSRVCVYRIAQPPGKAIRLQFLDFEVEVTSYPRCNFDYLQIRDGDSENSTLIGQYCGGNDKTPPSVISTHNFLWLKFSTDSALRNRGFKANYSTFDIECGGILHAPHGVISSPTLGVGDFGPKRCTWVVVAPAGHVVQLTFVNFVVGTRFTCDRNFVQAFDNSTVPGAGGFMGQWCGNSLPPVLTSSDSTMTVVAVTFFPMFVMTSQLSYFTASYITIDASRMCGGTYYTTTGVLTSPNYPGSYLPGKDCTWVLMAPAGQQIMLNVTAFQLEKHPACNFDYLEIRNGGYKTSPLVGKFCGRDIPRRIPSHSNQMYLRFVSDGSRSEAGFRLTWDSTATGCGGTLTAPSGSITSPNYPAPYGRFADCFWRIVVSQGSRVQLTFVDLDLENHSKCRMDFLEVRDGLDWNGKLHGKFCSSHPTSIVSKDNQLSLKFQSDGSAETRGFHLKYDTLCNTVVTGLRGVIESPNFPAPYPGAHVCNWTIKVAKGNRVNITFTHFGTEIAGGNTSMDPCRYDYLNVTESDQDEPNPSDKELGRFCGTDLPSSIASARDHVFLRFVSDAFIADIGFRLEWVLEGCGGLLEKPSGGFTSPGYPSSYLPSMACEWVITAPFDQSVQLNITDISMERSSECHFDHLQVWSGADDTGTSLGLFCHSSQHPMVITSSGSAMFVRFQSDSSMAGRGFKANYTLLPSRCGGKLTSPRGVLHSLNYPQNYGANDDCTWLIQVAPAYVVLLQFTDFDVDFHANCSMDYVRVYDGNSTSAPKVLDHCGSSLPAPAQLVATSNHMLVHFKSDGSSSAKGFKANYSVSCGARIVTDSSGLLGVGDAVSAGGRKQNCTWIIVATQPDSRVTFTVTYVDPIPDELPEGMDIQLCEIRSLQFRDGDSLDSPLIGGTHCGPTAPPSVTSSGSAMTVTLASRFGIYGHFAASYSVASSACGGYLTSERGAFLSPGYPVRYPADVECVWTLNASPGNRVQLSFSKFDIAPSESCISDYLEVREGDALGRLVGVYCTDLPANISASNRLWVKFRSSPVDSATSDVLPPGGGGFLAYYALVHGNELSGPRGKIASPLYPVQYVLPGEFSWRITVEFGFAVSIVFSEFFVPKTAECEYYLAVYDGFDESAPELLRACGTELPPATTSSANVVFVRLASGPTLGGSLFLLEWTQVPTAQSQFSATKKNVTGCGGTVVLAPEESRNLTSPGFPNGYAGRLDCEWLLETPPGFHVALKLTELQLEEGATCQYDSLRLFTGQRNKPVWRPLRTLCWPNATTETLNASALMRIVFHTDSSVNKTGFSAKISSECGGWLTDPSGVMEVSGVVGNSTKAGDRWGRLRVTECQWNVSVRAGRRIALKFARLDLFRDASDTTGGCGENYVVLKNGGSSASPLLGAGKFCGSTSPSELQTTGNRAFVKYRGVRTPLKGFRLEYREVSHLCGGSVQLSADMNATSVWSPNYPQIPPAHIECAWVVMAPAGRRVTLDFVERFDIAASPDCTEAAVEVRDGGTQGARLLGRYCGSQLPGSHDSLGNVLYVRFFTDVADPKNGFKVNLRLATCGGMLRSTRGLLTSPGHPGQYPTPAHCVWRIVAPLGHVISLNVQLLDVRSASAQNCTLADYLRIEQPAPGNETQLTELGTFCQTPNITVRTMTNEAVITFHSETPPKTAEPTYRRPFTLSTSVSSSIRTGFRISYNASALGCGGRLETPEGTFQSPGYPSGTSSNYCVWYIMVPIGRRIKVKLLDFDIDPPNTEAYSSTLYFTNGFDYRSYITSFNSSTPPTEVSSTSFAMTVSFWTSRNSRSRGFKASYTSDDPAVCGEVVTNPNGTVLQPPPASLNLSAYLCAWEFRNAPDVAQTLSLTLVNGSLGKIVDPACIRSYSGIDVAKKSLRMRNEGESYKGHRTADTLERLCGNLSMPVVVRSPYPLMSVRATYNKHDGRMDFWASMRSSPCGGVLSGPEERVTSPGFPSGYAPDLECAWVVNFPSGQNIQVNVTRLSLEPDPSCARDFLSVRNGPLPTSPLLGRYCAAAPPVFRSQSNQLWIDFHSDGANQGTGFEMLLTPVVDGCGGIFHADKGEIFSPGFPGRYPPSAECEWELRAQDGYTLQLTFVERFFVEQSPGCAKDFVEAFDWVEGAWSSLGRACGREAPLSFNSSTNQMRVLFRSDSANNAEGFKARWGVLCGGVINARTRGQLTSPGYPKTYGNDLVCNYTLLAPGDVISLRFDEFELEGGPPASNGFSDCRFDNLTIYGLATASSRKVTPLGTYCRTKAPPPRVFREAVTLLFMTDWTFALRGFRLSYALSSECGGVLTAPGKIGSPRSDSGSLGRLNCTWVITAPAHQVIVLKFSRLELEFSKACSVDAVEVYDGPWANPERLVSVFCVNGTATSPVVKSSNNQMTVTLRVDEHQPESTFEAAVDFTYVCLAKGWISAAHADGLNDCITTSLNSMQGICIFLGYPLLQGEDAGCGGSLSVTTTATALSSPDIDKDGRYEALLDCHWLLLAPGEQTVNLQLMTLDLAACVRNTTDACACDFIEARDGPSQYSELIGRYCLSSDTPPLSSSGSAMWVRFVTDAEGAARGFRALATAQPSACGPRRLNVTGSPQTLTSPGWPNAYPANLRCRWELYGNFPSRVQLHFDTLDLDDADCADSVTFTELAERPLITQGLGARQFWHFEKENLPIRIKIGSRFPTTPTKICGRSKTALDFYAESYNVAVIFVSDQQTSAKGFKLVYSMAGCTRNYTSTQGRILVESPKGSCYVTVTAPANHTVALYFAALRIRPSEGCVDQALEVREDGLTGAVLAKLCGYELPRPVFSTGPRLYLHSWLRDDGEDSSERFDITFVATDKGRGCGGRIFNYGGVFTSPLYPMNFRNASVCRWDVSVPIGTLVVLKFKVFDIGPKSTCASDFLEVLDVDPDAGTEAVRATYCGQDNPAVYLGETGAMAVRYTTSVHNGGTGWVARFMSRQPGAAVKL